MSLAHTQPSLLCRIDAKRRGIVTIPAGRLSGVTKPSVQSYSERYRGTEYETPSAPVVVSPPLVSRGRLLTLVASIATAVALGTTLGVAPA